MYGQSTMAGLLTVALASCLAQAQPPVDWVHEGQDVYADLARWQGGVGMARAMV